MNISQVQQLLAKAGYYDGAIDGDPGPQTWAAVAVTERNAPNGSEGWSTRRRLVAAGQRVLNAMEYGAGTVDGYAGHNTREALGAWLADLAGLPFKALDREPLKAFASAYPLQKDMAAFYGPAGGKACTAGVVHLPCHFVIAWNTRQTITSFRCHEKVARPLRAIFQQAHDHYGQKRFLELELNVFGGCFNHRNMRGGSTLSTHAYGAAVDLNPTKNQLRWGADRAQFAGPDYVDWWDIVESHGGVPAGRAWGKDWMHFQFARLS